MGLQLCLADYLATNIYGSKQGNQFLTKNRVLCLVILLPEETKRDFFFVLEKPWVNVKCQRVLERF